MKLRALHLGAAGGFQGSMGVDSGLPVHLVRCFLDVSRAWKDAALQVLWPIQAFQQYVALKHQCHKVPDWLIVSLKFGSMQASQ